MAFRVVYRTQQSSRLKQSRGSQNRMVEQQRKETEQQSHGILILQEQDSRAEENTVADWSRVKQMKAKQYNSRKMESDSLDWTGLDWIPVECKGLDWNGPDRIGLDWIRTE